MISPLISWTSSKALLEWNPGKQCICYRCGQTVLLSADDGAFADLFVFHRLSNDSICATLSRVAKSISLDETQICITLISSSPCNTFEVGSQNEVGGNKHLHTNDRWSSAKASILTVCCYGTTRKCCVNEGTDMKNGKRREGEGEENETPCEEWRRRRGSFLHLTRCAALRCIPY